MPRQTYLSKEFFVNASEQEAKARILSIPEGVNNIKFVAEDGMRHSMKFIYEQWSGDAANNCIQVSLLPLSVNQTRVSLHGSHHDGTAFYKDVEVDNALSNFERAVQAAIQGSIHDFEPQEAKRKEQKSINTIAIVALLAGVVYIIKQLFV
jgi:hypothetical protein